MSAAEWCPRSFCTSPQHPLQTLPRTARILSNPDKSSNFGKELTMTEKPSTQLSTDEVKKSPAAVILAAGRGSRMGSVKALLPWWNGETLLEAWIRRFKEVGCSQVLVVVGHQAQAVQDSVSKDLEVTWVANDRAAENGARESLILALFHRTVPLVGLAHWLT